MLEIYYMIEGSLKDVYNACEIFAKWLMPTNIDLEEVCIS